MHGNRARARQLVPTEHTISASARPASIDKDAKALSILSASVIGCCLLRIWEQPAPVGCSSDGSGNRHGEGHDEISRDRLGGSVLAGRSYVLPWLKMAQPLADIHQRGGTPIFLATMDTMVTTLDLAMRLGRPTTFWAIPSHTMAPTDLGATGGS